MSETIKARNTPKATLLSFANIESISSIKLIINAANKYK